MLLTLESSTDVIIITPNPTRRLISRAPFQHLPSPAPIAVGWPATILTAIQSAARPLDICQVPKRAACDYSPICFASLDVVTTRVVCLIGGLVWGRLRRGLRVTPGVWCGGAGITKRRRGIGLYEVIALMGHG